MAPFIKIVLAVTCDVNKPMSQTSTDKLYTYKPKPLIRQGYTNHTTNTTCYPQACNTHHHKHRNETTRNPPSTITPTNTCKQVMVRKHEHNMHSPSVCKHDTHTHRLPTVHMKPALYESTWYDQGWALHCQLMMLTAYRFKHINKYAYCTAYGLILTATSLQCSQQPII